MNLNGVIFIQIISVHISEKFQECVKPPQRPMSGLKILTPGCKTTTTIRKKEACTARLL